MRLFERSFLMATIELAQPFSFCIGELATFGWSQQNWCTQNLGVGRIFVWIICWRVKLKKKEFPFWKQSKKEKMLLWTYMIPIFFSIIEFWWRWSWFGFGFSWYLGAALNRVQVPIEIFTRWTFIDMLLKIIQKNFISKLFQFTESKMSTKKYLQLCLPHGIDGWHQMGKFPA